MDLRWTDRPRSAPTHRPSHLIDCPVGAWVCRPNRKPSQRDEDMRIAMERFDREAGR